MRAVDMHLLQELVRLHRLGLSNRVIAKQLGISRNTEHKYRAPLTAAGLLDGDPNALPELAEIKAVVAAVQSDDTPVARPRSRTTIALAASIAVSHIFSHSPARAAAQIRAIDWTAH